MNDRLVSVAVPVPALGLLTYRVPATLSAPAVGARVVVPLGKRRLTGVVVEQAATADATFEIRDVLEVLDATAFVPPAVLALCAWVADYYLAGPGAALSAALPPHGLTARVDAFKTARWVTITAQGLDVRDRLRATPRCFGTAGADLPRLGARQLEAIELLGGHPDGWSLAQMSERGIPASAITRLRSLGLVAVSQRRVERDPFVDDRHAPEVPDTSTARALTGEQQAAFDSLAPLVDAGEFRAALLHGVTGSGKTELYIRLADRARRRGRRALVLVPEIALTPQVAALFRASFGNRVAIQHSGLSDGERHDQWHRIRRGEVDVVVGTRSAVFAPIDNVGLIIVDEEHDTSYKQEETPRYHGRDVAVMRAKLGSALVVLGSATPSMESYFNARAGRYTLVSLDRRILDRPLADVRVVNMREEMAEGDPDVVLSRALIEGLTSRLAARQQAVILLNRRGFAAAVFCRQCGHTMDCPNCSVSLTVHTRGRPGVHPLDDRRGWRARCHYCNYLRPVPPACPQCAAPYLEHVGFGTERVEAEVHRHLPDARVARVDRDTVRRRGSLVDVLQRFARHELDVLVGTQMIAKGHDFPNVTLVGVISADVGLGLADFRAAERTFQLLTQVAGRAGRGERAGEAIVQTLFPSHYSIRLACTQDYRAFFEKEAQFRHAMRYPPHVAMVNVVVRGRSAEEAMTGASDLAGRVRRAGRDGFVVLGPAPAPLTRLRGEHRMQFFLKGTSRAAMRQALKAALDGVPALARRVAVDVDPVSML